MVDQVTTAVAPEAVGPETVGAGEIASGESREAVGIFDTYEALQDAVDALLLSGFARCELSLPAAQTGPQADEPAAALADDPAARRTDHFCTEALGDAEGSLISGFTVVPAMGTAWIGAAAGASLLATAGFAVATAGTGALIGAALAALLARRRRLGFDEQAEHGGLLLWVRTRTPELEECALDILRRHAAHHVHAHDLPALA